jgi:5-(carboxyamino)imidazole ribonucleotide synthase
MSAVAHPVLPGSRHDGSLVTLGVMGGGQLGRMFVHAAQQMGYLTAVLDPDAHHSPAGRVSHHHIATDYLDTAGLAQLAQQCSAITTEFENVPAPALRVLAAQCRVSPGADAVAVAQDRRAEKAHFDACGVPCAPYAVLESALDIEAAPEHLLPGIVKTACLGYDGKGQVRVADRAALRAAFAQLKGVPCVLEQQLPLAQELSVIVARGADGDCVHFPVQCNLHRAGILAVTEVFEGRVAPGIAALAIAAARSIAEGLDYVGVLCVEFFVLADGRLVVNEMAPRPHNSGHYTLDACDVSQFDLQVRTLAGLPLPQPRQHSAAVMLNVLGDLWIDDPRGPPRTPDWVGVLALPGAHLHLYGKREARAGRKMGHLTFTGADAQAVRQRALAACTLLGLPAF